MAVFHGIQYKVKAPGAARTDADAWMHASAQASISIVDIPCSIVYLPEGFH